MRQGYSRLPNARTLHYSLTKYTAQTPEEEVEADMDVEEAVSENAMMMMANQTADGNMTGTNSTS